MGKVAQRPIPDGYEIREFARWSDGEPKRFYQGYRSGDPQRHQPKPVTRRNFAVRWCWAQVTLDQTGRVTRTDAPAAAARAS